MTAQTLPDNPNSCFCPAYDVEDEVQQIRLVIEGMSGYVPTALVTLTVHGAEEICDKLNRRLGLDREAWTALAAGAIRAEEDDPDGAPWTEPPPARRRLRPTRTRQPPPRDPDRQADHHGTDSDRERLRDDRRHSAADPDCHDGTRPMTPTIVKDDGHLSIRSYTLKQNTHSHAFHQIVIPLNGAIDIAFEDQRHTVGVGHCIVIRSGTVHSYSAPEQSRFLVADTARLPANATELNEACVAIGDDLLAFCIYAETQLRLSGDRATGVLLFSLFWHLLEQQAFAARIDERVMRTVAMIEQDLTQTHSIGDGLYGNHLFAPFVARSAPRPRVSHPTLCSRTNFIRSPATLSKSSGAAAQALRKRPNSNACASLSAPSLTPI